MLTAAASGAAAACGAAAAASGADAADTVAAAATFRLPQEYSVIFDHIVKAMLHMDHLVLKFRLAATFSDWAAILDLYQQLLMMCRSCGVFGTSGAEPGPQAEEAGLLRFGSDCQAQRGHGRSGDGG